MTKGFEIKKKDGAFYVLIAEDKKIVISLKIKEWETDFFKRKFGSLFIKPNLLNKLSYKNINNAIDSLLSYADQKQYDLIELCIDISGIELISILEDKGFRLVDTRISFITLMKKKDIKKYSSDIGEISFASPGDLEELLNLTHLSFTNNHSFFSRFKNRAYFTQEDTEKYYSAWIKNYLGAKDTLFAVLKINKKIIGYSIWKMVGHQMENYKYKAILSAVVPESRGHNIYFVIQSFLCNNIPKDQFYLDNSTQLTNSSIIKNHIRTQKKLGCINLTFFRSKKI